MYLPLTFCLFCFSISSFIFSFHIYIFIFIWGVINIYVCINMCMHAKSLLSCQTLQPCGLQPAKLLCPWDSPDKNIEVGCHDLLQAINIYMYINVHFFPHTLCIQYAPLFLNVSVYSFQEQAYYLYNHINYQIYEIWHCY